MALLLRGIVIVGAILIAWRMLRRGLTSRPTPPKGAMPNVSPYEVLDVDPKADLSQIKKAYYARLAQYHPDKVAHLGPELQKLAEVKTREINQAYQQLVDLG